jgi:PAS domain S-box-containing protein
MSRLIDPHLHRRATVLLAGAAIVTVTLIGVTLRCEGAARDAALRDASLHGAQGSADAVLIGMTQEQAALSGYVETALADFLQDYDQGRRTVDTAITTLRRNGPPVTDGLDAVVRTRDEWGRWAVARQAVVRARGAQVVDTPAVQEGQRRFVAFRTAHADLVTAVTRAASAAVAESSMRSRDAAAVTATGVTLDGAALVLLGLLLWRSTLRPLLQLARAAESLAESNPVTIPPSGRRDEVGALTAALAVWQTTIAEQDAMFRISPDAQVIGDLDGRLTDVNASMEELSGHSRDQLLARPFTECIHPDDRGATAQAIAQLVRGGRVAHEARMLCGDGSVRSVAWSAVRSPTRDLIHGIGRDITAEKRALRALEEQARLIELAHDAIIVRSVDSAVITYWSRGAEETYGWSTAEALGRTTHGLLRTGFPQPLAEIDSEVLSTGSWSGELTHHRRDGSTVIVHSRWAVRTGAAGVPTGILEVNRDLTERLNAEEALRHAAREALSANRAKSDFLSHMSHELRTPLNAVLGFAGLLEMELEGRQHHLVQTISAAGRHLLELINDVLDISCIEAGMMHMSLEPVSLEVVVREAAELVEPMAASRGIDMRIEPHTTERGTVIADAQRLKQVLLNLLSNAVKYNRDGGDIRIRVVANARRLRVGVSDTGAGIPQEMLGRLFLPFDRLGVEQSAVEGTGLGLAISHGIVTAMGGAIWADSGPEGSTFWVELDVADETVANLIGNASRAFDSAPPGPAATPRRTVLYVEDDLSNLRLIRSILELRPEVDLVPAMQGRLALELARANDVALILLVLHHPSISGQEVLEQLRADERTRDVPVVVVSGEATPGQVDRLLQAGARVYLTRPLDVRKFLVVLDEALGAPTGVAGPAPGR